MSVNANDSIFFNRCLISTPSNVIFITFYIANLFLLYPICILILYLGVKQWQQQRSTSTATILSHSDSFTYHLVTMELIGALGSTLCFYGIFMINFDLLRLGYCLSSFTWYGETFFHILTCLERYLAVVYPITYLSLRSERGIRFRNSSIGFVWLLSSGATSLSFYSVSLTLDFVLMTSSVIVISLCSFSVLRILIRPGPGEQGGERVDKSKRRAFYTIVAILAVLLLRSIYCIAWVVLNLRGHSSTCVAMISEYWFTLPSSLVLPILFLQRAGILGCCKNKPK